MNGLDSVILKLNLRLRNFNLSGRPLRCQKNDTYNACSRCFSRFKQRSKSMEFIQLKTDNIFICQSGKSDRSPCQFVSVNFECSQKESGAGLFKDVEVLRNSFFLSHANFFGSPTWVFSHQHQIFLLPRIRRLRLLNKHSS